MAEKIMRKFAITYTVDGQTRVVSIMADDQRQADRAMQAIARGRMMGEVMATVPAHSAWLAYPIMWWKLAARMVLGNKR